MMFRCVPVATLALTVGLLASASAMGQTVADYDAAVAKVPSAPPQAVAAACRPVGNYVVTSMGPTDHANPGPLSLIPVPVPYLNTSANDADVNARRADCVKARLEPVIAFNAGSAEEIVTSPSVEDDDILIRADPALPGSQPQAPTQRVRPKY